VKQGSVVIGSSLGAIASGLVATADDRSFPELRSPQDRPTAYDLSVPCETTISTRALPTSALNAVRTAAEVSPAPRC
jgi:hypothetical protein